ncbi:MAG TPA: response regulator [Deltaproteobacteria bacterium]|nr:response regulator [Deltaproteobacteria bacterium]
MESEEILDLQFSVHWSTCSSIPGSDFLSLDLVILDMIMPDMGGGEVYNRMKEIKPEVRCLLSSGYSIDGQASEILAQGCNGFIQKPFSIEVLSRKIREVLKC